METIADSRGFMRGASAVKRSLRGSTPMEKSLRPGVEPGQGLNIAVVLAISSGLALFWSCLFTLLVKNGFAPTAPGAEAAAWEPLALRIALFFGFAAASLAVSRLKSGAFGKRSVAASTAAIALAALDTALVGITGEVGFARPFAADVAAWAVLGIGLSCLLFLWMPLLDGLSEAELAGCLSLSAACGAVICLGLHFMEPVAAALFLAGFALASLAFRMALASDASAAALSGKGRSCAECAEKRCESRHTPPASPIPLGESKENAHLSWAFGIINIIYGVVFGLGAASVTQLAPTPALEVGTAAALVAGAACAHLFIRRAKGRVRQSAVLRMLSPVLVVALVPQSFFSGSVYALCNLLLLGCYLFLVIVSIGFELRGARERHASPLYFVGMSQASLSLGLALGFALGLVPLATGTLDRSALSGVALGLVVVLAVFVAATQGRMTDAQQAADELAAREQMAREHAETGRWKTRCADVARKSGLTARETEVFMLLAKGRGIEHIQNKLGISSHTVKSHTYNIYHKMGISSREELLDAIEAEK